MNEKLEALKKLLASDDFNVVIPIRREDLEEMITIIEAVNAPNLQLAIERFQLHCVRLNARLQSQVEAINRLLIIAEDAKRAARRP